MATEYGSSSNAAKLAMGRLIGVAGVGRKPFTIGSGFGEYNYNKYHKVGSGHVNRDQDLAKEMKNFLGGQGQTIFGSEGSRELLTVAQEYGRKGAAIQLQTIIVNQVSNARNSAHFRIMRPRAMTDAELKGYRQEILKYQYTPPTEAPEFAPPHYLSFESEIYEGQGYRFNNGFRFNAEMLLTNDGLELLAQYAEVAINNFVKLMEQIVTYCLMGVEDRYKNKKLLIDSGALSEEELMHKYKYNGQMMAGSFLAYSKVPGILQRRDGFEFLLNWVKKVTQSQNVNITHCLVVPDSLIGISFDRTDYSERGPEATRALYEGEEFTKSIIRRINGIEIIEQPTYEMRDARIKTEQALSNIMEIGQHYILCMTPYHRLRSIQSARGIDSKAPRRGAAVNDLYYLDYSTDEVTKRHQKFSELMQAALCWDEHGELNEIVYRDLENNDFLRHLVSDIGIQMTEPKHFKPDPWLVWSSEGHFKRVNIVGNQDTYHTSVEDTKFAIDVAHDMISSNLSDSAQKGYSKLIEIMDRNKKVVPDSNGDIEGFWTACAWTNVEQAELDENEAIWHIREMKLPELCQTYNQTGNQMNIHAYCKKDPQTGISVVCVKAPLINTSERPQFYANVDPAFNNVTAEKCMHLAGYVKVVGQNQYVDLHSLLAYIDEEKVVVNDIITEIFVRYRNNYGNDNVQNEISQDQFGLLQGILKEIPAESSKDRLSYFLYSLPAQATNAVFFELDSVKAFDAKSFSSERKNQVDHRLLSIYLQKGYYDEIKDQSGPRFGKSIQVLAQNAEKHPAYLWIDRRLVNDQNGRGCVDSEGRIVSDPTKIQENIPENLSVFRLFDHRSFWSTKMAMLGYVYPSFFYQFSDLQKCRVFGQTRGALRLPAVSTFSAMKSIADQMSTSYGESGWQNVDSDGLIKTIIEGTAEIDKFIDCCYRIFSPQRSSHSHRPMESGLCFLSDKFLHRSQISQNVEEDAKRCFANIVFPSAARLMALINPFIHYPLFVNKEACLSQQVIGPGNPPERLSFLYDRKHVEVTMRFTDIEELTDKTPFIISSISSQSRSVRGIGADSLETVVPSSYNYLSGKAQKYQTTGKTEFIIAQDKEINDVVDSFTADEQKFVVRTLLTSVFKHLMKDSNFLYVDDISNENLGALVGDRVDFKLTGGAGASKTNQFFSKLAELLRETINSYPKIFENIDEYYKALFFFIKVVHEFFMWCFDDETKRNKITSFKLSADIIRQVKQYAEQKATDLGKLYAQRARGASSSGVISSDSKAAYEQHVQALKNDFARQLYKDTGSGRKQLYVTNMFLSVDPKYWITLDSQMKRLYGLTFDGYGVQLSIARPQERYGTGFVDTVIDPSLGGGQRASTYTTPGHRIAKYTELVDFGPGSKSSFNLNSLLIKYAHGSNFHHHNNINIDKMVQEHFGVNQFFMDRYNEIEDNWAKKAIALAYLTARPTADLMISLHDHGIPQPMVLIPTDPFMTFRMNSMLFVDATDDSAFLGHHLTMHTSGMDSDTREMRDHFSAWIFPYWPRPEKVVQVPNVSFSGVISGCSGRIIKSIAGVRSYGKKTLNALSDESEVDWDPANPYARKADRFVNYGGGSVTSEKVGSSLNIVGNNTCPGSNLNCGIDLPLGLIPVTNNNSISHPSALVFNVTTGYSELNRDCDQDFLHPSSYYHVRANKDINRKGGVWNVWTYRGKQYIINYETGAGDQLRDYGSGPLSDIEANDGFYLKGMPKMFKSAPVSTY